MELKGTRSEVSDECWNVSRSELRLRLLLGRPRSEVVDQAIDDEVGRWKVLMEGRAASSGPASK